ncbi:hypothetical protein GCM10028801_36290 [Nocardioides maradonensis]
MIDTTETARRKAATPAYDGWVAPEDIDLDAWNQVGDPIAEALVGLMRDRKLMGGDLLATARRLRADGVGEADAFFTDVEWVPAWADFDAMLPGALMGRRCAVGLVLGIHGALPMTYVDPATARVMASTGRLARSGDDFGRRFWETAAGFAGALDVDGMRPGGPRWEQWVRIRLLHTCIRLGILRSGRWDPAASVPISQTPTAAGAHIFGRYRVNVIRHLGGRVSEEEAESFDLMWRWIARLQGASTELLGRDSAEQLAIAVRIGHALYGPDADSAALTSTMIDGLARMRSTFPIPRRAHSGIVRALLAAELTEVFPDVDVAADLGLPADRRTDLVASAVTAGGRGLSWVLDRLPSTPDLDLAIVDRSVERGLRHRPATFRPTPVAGDL